MDLTQKQFWKIYLRLLAPFLISVTPWPFTIILMHNATSSDLEGDYYLTASVGVLSFILTGPLAGVALERFLREKELPFSFFAGLLFLVSLPTLSFQVIAFSSSMGHDRFSPLSLYQLGHWVSPSFACFIRSATGLRTNTPPP